MILVTGCAGFIGFHLTNRLLAEGETIIGIDNLNSYYDVKLKQARLAKISSNTTSGQFRFYKGDLENYKFLEEVFSKHKPDLIVNLAAQAGVRYSLESPYTYLSSNITGFLNILEICRKYPVKHLLYASSSSVYGANAKLPYSESDDVSRPLSLYASSKKTNELMAHTYSHLFKIPSTGLRFFTVYGPWGRPDMALFLFTEAILKGKQLDVYNHGNMVRDFTFVEDIVESVARLINLPPSNKTIQNGTHFGIAESNYVPYRIVNIGNSTPTPLMNYILELESCLGRKARLNYMPMQMGDVMETSADTSLLQKLTGYKPKTSINEGIRSFVNWYLDFYKY